jgi:hypothetical protein
MAEMTAYLRWLSARAEVIVVDGSPPELFDRHHAEWPWIDHHRPPDRSLSFANGKVNGVTTGVLLASHEAVVVADDDVRYDREGLDHMVELLGRFDLVRPQNYFSPAPWHARWDTARTLLNRAFGHDHPGTLGIRRTRFVQMGGYDGDCLFENLELVRTVRAAGGAIVDAPGLYVARRPPTARRFVAQRIRQAYDDFAQPARMALFLTAGPAAAFLLARRRWGLLGLAAAVSVAAAERGRRRHGGARVFPPSASLLAPAWVAERAVCSWLAILARARGGAAYAGTRLRCAAHSTRSLSRRPAVRDASPQGLDWRGGAPPVARPEGAGALSARNFTSL